MTDVDPVTARLGELGIEPILLPVFGTFERAVRTGDLLHTMGHWPLDGDRPVTGTVGAELSVADGRAAAELAARALVGTLQDELGRLDRVARLASVLVTVHATSTFTEHTAVADAASDLLVSVFGEAGRHARLAVGVSSLPADLALELTAVVQVRDRAAQPRA